MSRSNTAIIATTPGLLGPASLTEDQVERLRPFMDGAKEVERIAVPPNTEAAYASAWARFRAWCAQEGFTPLPAHPAVVVAFLQASVEQIDPLTDAPTPAAVSTLEVRLAAIKREHERRGGISPTAHPAVKQHMKNLRHLLKKRPKRKRKPLTLDLLGRCLDALPYTHRGVRDRVILTLGFAGAFRRSELSAITVDALEWTPEGLTVLLPGSKTDQEGEGVEIAVLRGDGNLDAVYWVQTWMRQCGVKSSFLLRAVDRWGNIRQPDPEDPSTPLLANAEIDRIVREAVTTVLNAEEAHGYGGHSLRAGFITEAARLGWSEEEIMQHTRHESVEVMRGYIRRATRFERNPSAIMAGIRGDGRKEERNDGW